MLIISSVITLFSICGAVWNAKGSIRGFYIWLPANIAWVIYDISIKEYPQAVLFIVYSIISAFGIYQWRNIRLVDSATVAESLEGGYGMKAEDTVMNPIQLSERIQYFPDWDLARGNQFIEELCYYIARSQAEITWDIAYKAGFEEGRMLHIET